MGTSKWYSQCTTELKTIREASMKQTIIHVGLDVDDTQYHGSALDKHSGEVIDFKCRPTLKGCAGTVEQNSQAFFGMFPQAVL